MNSKKYWVFRALFQKVVFAFNSLRYRFAYRMDGVRRTRLISFYILRRVAWDVLAYSMLAVVLYFADSFLRQLLKQGDFSADTTSSIVAIIVGGMGIGGVILGLYCSNIASVYSQIYAKASKSLSYAFHKDTVTNKCIKRITGIIVFGCILLIECVVVRCPYYVSMIAWLLLLIWAVITFGVTRNRTYVLSDSYSLSENVYPLISSAMKKTAKHSYVGEDARFQNQSQLFTIKQLDILKEIAIFNQNNTGNNNSAMIYFMIENIKILQQYWSIKSQIPFDSKWFEEENIHKQWHLASESEIQIRVQTGTALEQEKRKNTEWFERRLLEINDICLERLCKDRDYRHIYTYLTVIGNTTKYAIKGNSLAYWNLYINQTVKRVILLCKSVEELENNRNLQGAIVDACVLIFLGRILEINQYLSKLDIHAILKEAVEIADSRSLNYTSNMCYNTNSFKDLLNRIDTEIRIEHKRITPNWYIEQMIAKEIFDFCNVMIESLKNNYENLFDLGTSVDSVDHHYFAIIALSRFFEMESKTSLVKQQLEGIIPELEKTHKEKRIIWGDCKYKALCDFQNNNYGKYIDNIIRCSESFAIENWGNRGMLPDFLGECYNNICECLIQAIEKNNFDRFKKIYVLFLQLTLLYKEYIGSDLIKRKEEYLQSHLYCVLSSPYVEYAKISSYAIICGEFNDDVRWKEYIETTNVEFLKNEISREFIESMPNIIKTRSKVYPGMDSRGLIHTNWDLRIIKVLQSSSKCQFEYQGVAKKVLKTDSRLLQVFCESQFDHLDFGYPVEDVFIVVCINNLISPEKRYYGQFDWGKEIDKENE